MVYLGNEKLKPYLLSQKVRIDTKFKEAYKGLRFKATQPNSTISIKKMGSQAPDVQVQYSLDEGETWNDYTIDFDYSTNIITIPRAGGAICFKAKTTNERMGANAQNFNRFVMGGGFEASGNVNSLLNENFDEVNVMSSQAFLGLFKGCSSLTRAPELPATTLGFSCYESMFEGCSSLVEAPILPETELLKNDEQYCCCRMFQGCTSLIKAPSLPINIIRGCFNGMFMNCTSLTQAPRLHARHLDHNCYYDMFNGCTSLKSVTMDFSTIYPKNCCRRMFNGCTSLNSIRLTNYEGNFQGGGIDSTIFQDWVRNVESEGTLYYNGSDTTRGINAIPNGWNVVRDKRDRYRYFKMVVSKKSSDISLQFAKIDFVDLNGNRCPYPSGTTTSIENLSPYPNEGSDNLIDGTTNTKMCAKIDALPCSITFDLGQIGISIKNYPKYQWWTANDKAAERSPLSWKFMGSNDNINWVVLDEVVDFNTSGIKTNSLGYEGSLN